MKPSVDAVSRLHSQSTALYEKYKQEGELSSLEEAIALGRDALDRSPAGHPDRATSFIILGLCLSARYKRHGAMQDLDDAIDCGREAVGLSGEEHLSERPRSLNVLGLSLSMRYQQHGDLQDLEEAIVLEKNALALSPKGHPNRLMSLNNLGHSLFIRYRQRGALQDIEQAISLGREAVDDFPSGDTDRALSLNNLGRYLSIRYERLGDLRDLEEAIAFERKALGLCSERHPTRFMSLNALGRSLFAQYRQSGTLQDLEEAITLEREALDLCMEGNPDHPLSLNALGVCLSARYDRLGTLEDLEESVVLERKALDLRPKGHPARILSLNSLGCSLYTRYQQRGAPQDLEEAIGLGREALDTCMEGHPDRMVSHYNLGFFLIAQYERCGVVADIEEAIILEGKALDLCPQRHPNRSRSLNNLSGAVFIRYNLFGALQDLEKAIALLREAVDLCPRGHPARPTFLINLTNYLCTRCKHLGSPQDLEEATALAQELLELRPNGHPYRSQSLDVLVLSLSARYNQLGALQDLEQGIVAARESLGLSPKGHPNRLVSLNNLAFFIFSRYKRLGVLEDLEEAIILGRELLEHRPAPKGCPNMLSGYALYNLGSYLYARYKRLGSLKDFDEAVLLSREAFELCPPRHPDRSLALSQLASLLLAGFSRSGKLQEKEELFDIYTQLEQIDQAVYSGDISAAAEWISAAEDFRHPSLLLAYETGLRLLVQHLASLPSLPQHLTIFKDRASSLAVDAFSACLRHAAPARAVELLEQGRSVFWSQLTRLQFPLDEVETSGEAGKALADKFRRLVVDMKVALNAPSPDQHEKLWHLNFKMGEILTGIRQLPGLSRFLLPPLFSDLRRAASGGPVIILNASQYSCDALVVFVDRDPAHIPLHIARESIRRLSNELHALTAGSRKMDMTRDLAVFLREIWDRIISPVVALLKTAVAFGSRIWWCPTAEFSLLPLHAAGPYRKGQRNLADLYISSYTPTMTALIHSRQYQSLDSIPGGRHFVAIGQATASGESKLPSVGAELDNVRQLVDGLVVFTRIDGKESSICKVVEALEKNEWVHLACHGVPSPARPFESAFALHDGRFTIQRMIGCKLEHPEFAYLSACHTTVGYEGSPDEAIHLASAMQFIGFRSVIGTMWGVDDGETKKVTARFYKHIVDESGRLDYTRAAYALNKIVNSGDVPFDQRILYVHIGA